MAALNPAIYTSPKDDHGAADLPDVAYYRRLPLAGKLGGRSRSVVIPFYWGFREEERAINKRTTHGEWLDRFGNRLDKDGIKQGGMFANATTNIPDMFGLGFSGRLLGAMPVNPVFGSPGHPLMPAPARRYMVLAALRLTALVKSIRGYKGQSGSDGLNDSINVVGHSQGTLITLLANAFLKDEGERPIDALVMMSSPYSLVGTFLENTLVYHNQQTTLARLQTLQPAQHDARHGGPGGPGQVRVHWGAALDGRPMRDHVGWPGGEFYRAGQPRQCLLVLLARRSNRGHEQCARNRLAGCCEHGVDYGACARALPAHLHGRDVAPDPPRDKACP